MVFERLGKFYPSIWLNSWELRWCHTHTLTGSMRLTRPVFGVARNVGVHERLGWETQFVLWFL